MKKPAKKRRKRGTRKKRAQITPKPEKVTNSDAGSIPVKEDIKKNPYLAISKKEPEKKKEEKPSILRYLNVAGNFLREAKMELKKVKWPTRKELLASTAMVIVLVLVIALFLGLIDFGLIKIIKNIVG